MTRKFAWRAVGALVLILAAIGSFNMAAWVSDRNPPIAYLGVRPLASVVEQGGTITVEFDVFRYRICQTDASRWLYDSAMNRHAIPSWTTGLERLAGREVYRRKITIPYAALPGPAQYQVVLEFECNPLQRILSWPVRVTSPSVTFVIRPASRPTLPLRE